MTHRYNWPGQNKVDRIERAAHHFGHRRSYRSIAIDGPDAFDPDKVDAKRHGIGGNNAPAFDPDLPVTGFPSVMRDIGVIKMDNGMEITSRSKLRDYERTHGVKQVGLEFCADSDKPKAPLVEEYKDHRKERERQLAKGKADPGTWKQRKARDAKSKAKSKG